MAKSTATTATFSPADLAIMGGLDLPERERGPLDTTTDKSHPLYDERLKLKLDPQWVENIKTRGVREFPNIVLIDGTPFVVNGRQRVRAARVVNRNLQEGEAPLSITCHVTKVDGIDMLRDMVALNVHTDDAVAIKIAKCQRLLAQGETVEGCAVLFATRPATIKAWVQYDATAIPEVKKVVNSGKIPQTTGAEIARLPKDKQSAALAAVLKTTPKTDRKERTGSAAKAKRAIARAGGKSTAIADKKTLKRFLEAVSAIEHPPSTKGTELMWWAGVEAGLHFVLGGDGQDAKLTAILDTMDDASNVPDGDSADLGDGDVE